MFFLFGFARFKVWILFRVVVGVYLVMFGGGGDVVKGLMMFGVVACVLFHGCDGGGGVRGLLNIRARVVVMFGGAI